jgi:hypothetical protein
LAVYVDPRTGETYDNVPEEDQERARSEFGLIPHEEWQQREADKAVDTKGPVGLIAEGAERGLGHAVDVGNTVADAVMPKGYGTAPGLVDETPRATGASLFPEANSDAGRRRTELHPYLEGAGTGLAAAPFAAAGGALAGGLGLGALGAGAAATTASTVVEAAAQEYDDAWLEKRPMELKNVAGLTAMFGLGGVILHQAGKVVGKVLGLGGEEAAGDALGGALGGTSPKPSGLGGRNIVAEATAKAEHAAGGNGSAARSVGAASAEELQEPFDAAIGSMTDRDAVVLARDADDHLQLVARHSADDWTRVHKGLSESLGNQLKYRDVQIATDALTPKQVAANNAWTREAVDKALGVAEQIRTGGPSGLDYGAAGKTIASDIERYSKLIMDEPDLAKRFQTIDTFKKVTDKRIMQVAGNFQGDPFARSSLLEHMDGVFGGPETKGFIREGLENPKYWGHAGTLQKALNAPWHDMLKHWSKVTDRLLEHTGETQFGVMGAGRKPMQGTAERLLAVFQKDPRVLSEFGKDLSGVFDGYQRLIEAREAHGIVEKEGLPELAQSVRNLMEDWNLAATVGIARNKVRHASLNPKRLEKLLALAEKAPFGVGGAVGAARQVAGLAGDLRIQKGTPLADVWDRGLKRYALHPELADPSIHANYSPWMQEALRARGAPIPGGTPPAGGGTGSLFGGAASPGGPSPAAPAASGGGFGQAAAAAAKEHGGKVAGVGLLAGASALEDKDNPNGAAAAGAAGLGLLLGGKGLMRAIRPIAEEVAPEALRHAEMMAGRKPSGRLWRSIADAKGMRTFADGLASKYHTAEAFQETAERVAKDLSPEHRRALEHWTGYGYKNLQATPDAETGKAALAALNDAVSKGLTTPGETTRGVWLTPDELERFKADSVFVSPGFMSTSANRNYPRQFLANKAAESTEGKVPVIFQVHQVSGVPLPFQARESEILLRPGTTFDARVVRDEVRKGVYEDTVHLFERQSPPDVAGAHPAPIAGGLLIGLGVAAAAGNARAAPPPSLEEPPDPGPSPQVGPVGVYRDAMRTVAQGGEALIRQKATAALRMSAPKGRGALHAFMGRRNLDDAVDAARDALRDLQNDPEALVDRLAGTTGELGTTHPAVYMALVEKAHGLVSYLAAEAPQRTGKTLLDPEGTAPSHDRSLDFAFKTVGALMPVQAMNDVARLDAAPEEVAAFQQNWPELWEPLRAELLGQVQRRTEAGRPVDSEKLRQLDALLQMDGQLDPSASSAVAQQMLSAQEQAAPPAQGGGGGGSGGGKPSGAASSSFRTRLDSAQMENAIG